MPTSFSWSDVILDMTSKVTSSCQHRSKRVNSRSVEDVLLTPLQNTTILRALVAGNEKACRERLGHVPISGGRSLS